MDFPARFDPADVASTISTSGDDTEPAGAREIPLSSRTGKQHSHNMLTTLSVTVLIQIRRGNHLDADDGFGKVLPSSEPGGSCIRTKVHGEGGKETEAAL